MSTAAEIIRQSNKEKLWDKYFGYLDLDIREFMQIQERLLLEEINFLKDSSLGRLFLVANPIKPFRISSLTTNEEYVDFPLEKKEETLPPVKYIWARKSERSRKYPCKRIQSTEKIYEKLGELVVGAILFASCKYKEISP